MSPLRVLVIVPTYNEIENIEALARQVVAQSSDEAALDVLVVDDASADGTGQAVERLGAEDSRIACLHRPAKMGLGTAYIAGFRRAIEDGYDFAATMDADFSHSPNYLPALVEKARADSADLVIGSRYVPGGGVRNWGLHRRILSAGANLLARTVAGLRPHDCTAGFRLYRIGLLERLALDRINSNGYSCLIELAFECQRLGARIAESPIIFVDRRAGQSKISHIEILKAFRTLALLARRRFGGRAG